MLKEFRAILGCAIFCAIAALSAAPGTAQVALPGPSSEARAPAATAPAFSPATAPHMSTDAGAPALIADDNYRLGTGDKMKVTVYGEEDLSGEFLVDGSGQVQFPLIGQVSAAGMTVHEFVTELTTQLGSKYIRDPKVSVQIENYRPFYIMGEVNKPGEYPYENGLNVLGAIAVAGGYTYRANSNDVYIRRAGGAKEEVMPVNGATRIFPGDVVRVAERFF